nr:MAG TPA: Protein of unknown function (DUF1492) [Caudoviricetes sp.]
MTAKEYLEYVRSLEVRLRMKDSRISQLQRDICCIRALDYTKDRISGGSPVDISDKIARLDELIREANDEWDELIAERERAKTIIAKLESATQQEVLTKRYIQNKRWEQIAVEMNITWRHTFRIHRAALEEFSQKMALNVSILT